MNDNEHGGDFGLGEPNDAFAEYFILQNTLWDNLI